MENNSSSVLELFPFFFHSVFHNVFHHSSIKMEEGWKKISKGPRDEPVTYDIFEAHKTWEFSPYAPTLSELLSRAVEVEGIAFASLEDVQKWKKASGRPKDITDLKLIDDYLVGHTDS